ncbi:type II 3-dehydroquinate dehydratase [Caloramator sp. mosi_1]|uniref:type II 3-dehydroquinate dehydratase n=1 Tax=Caloramator sp. mosi_1 TaxID=3023090 RepID=UPI00235F8F7E|nr:type II 3-dehydroquinate dehydratase [Caloramator sp. mosi_1]WDC85815.1 type II 3-dehydroquinate dehydratase [Caloramator sp. mosi_1]
MKVLVVNGPNLNLLGIREKDIYGSLSYNDLCSYIKKCAEQFNIEVDIYQSNVEGELINYIQDNYKQADGLIINPGAYTHYSYALYDCIRSIDKPTIEVHLTNIYAREEFRQKSVTAPACIGVITGLKEVGYKIALLAIKDIGVAKMTEKD